ncbi:colicin immunity domain-containing protein [Pseudothauera rhizosphaerae]|uniref:Colicin D immunity protein domain-containing protein n=1 Tax=Pseudothauera rhizosphaerae TaxID=2565932 RepID=A0A4S4AU42_9RHOO|nr:colicin immunity domain-containing protein [Pseudothauera rhizosphaerae]THF63408.1 hypothetical protein E6O51_04950 [Pseudothauera rhizosphaerae]
MSNAAVEYGLLLKKFLDGAISVDEFRVTYFDRFKNEGRLNEPLFNLLDELFGDVDSFTTDQELLDENPEFYLDEKGLREKVQNVANRLSVLIYFENSK